MNPNYHPNQGYHGQVPTLQGAVVQTGTVPVGTVTANKWANPFNRNIQMINFDATCKKCHGTGVRTSTFSHTPLPCDRCYSRAGYCKKCYGSGMNYRKNKACNKCTAGKRLQPRSSSSSSSDTNRKGTNYNQRHH
jgi:hypothetical protein